jgi:predicted Rossmann-fold nucleotide-binding protein
MPGGAGTLGEVALAWNLRQMQLMPPKLIILVGGGWQRLVEAFSRELIVDEHDLDLLTLVENIEGAVAALTTEASQTDRVFG